MSAWQRGSIRHPRPQFADEGHRNPSLMRSARARRDDDCPRIQGGDGADRHLIVPFDANIESPIDLTKPLNEVVGERIVIIEYENHDGFRWVAVIRESVSA